MYQCTSVPHLVCEQVEAPGVEVLPVYAGHHAAVAGVLPVLQPELLPRRGQDAAAGLLQLPQHGVHVVQVRLEFSAV